MGILQVGGDLSGIRILYGIYGCIDGNDGRIGFRRRLPCKRTACAKGMRASGKPNCNAASVQDFTMVMALG